MDRQRIVVTGATGMIGRALVAGLLDRGDSVVALARNAARAQEILGETVEVHEWPEPTHSPPPVGSLTGADAVMHLLGEPVAQRWNPGVKRAIRDSRELATQMLVTGLRALRDAERPRTLISGSAVGFYGPRGDEPLDEHAGPGSDFLAETVVAWEREAARAEEIMRVLMARTGIVMSPNGGALGKMLPIFRLGLGGPIAGGRQYLSWIHLEDEVRGLLFCLDNHQARGPVNLVAPHPVTNAEFTRSLARAVRRPAILPVPGFGLRLMFGEMAQGVVTGQRAVPARLSELEYQFAYPEIGPALAALLSHS
ncbi:MAG TPA: TIGR01777 family oxidoreductase [Solirubrobacteraceae bacterium]|nr:TIGR01777 family oxidoreductase [Solirubrobacteraceae bacterium]